MVATSTLLNLTPIQWNPSFSYMEQRHHPSVHFYSKPQLRSNSLRLQIAVKYKQSTCFDADVRSDSNRIQIWKNSIYKIAIQIKEALDSLKNPAIAAVLLALLLLCDHNWALAASGGRIGGSAFSSRSQSSKSSSSSSTTFSKSRSSSASSYSSTRSKNSAPPRKSARSSWYSAPSFWRSAPSSRDSAPPRKSAPSSWDSSLRSEVSALSSGVSALPGISDLSLCLIMIGLAAFALVSDIISNQSQNDILTNTQKTSVLRLQVGLLGSARNLQQDFNHLAETADTSTPQGLSFLLTEATLALLRHPDYFISSYSSVDVKQCIEEGERQFNQLSVEERGKFDEETLVNVNSIKIQSSKIHRASGLNNEYIVVNL